MSFEYAFFDDGLRERFLRASASPRKSWRTK